MRYRTLGRTGLQVSELAMGGLFISRFAGDREQGINTVHRALDLGVNIFDTAPGYYDSEEVLGQALGGVTQQHFVCTKLGGRPQPFDPKDKAGLRASVKESLRLLRRDTLDLLLIHEPDRPGQYDWWDDWESFHGPVAELLDELKRAGIVRYTGLGGSTFSVRSGLSGRSGRSLCRFSRAARPAARL